MAKKEFSSKQGKELLNELLENGGTVEEAVKKLGIAQISDSGAIEENC